MGPAPYDMVVGWVGGGGVKDTPDGSGGLEPGGESESKSVEEWTERRPLSREVGMLLDAVALKVVGEIRETRIRCGGELRLLVGVDGAGEEGEAEGAERKCPCRSRDGAAEVDGNGETGEAEGKEGDCSRGWLAGRAECAAADVSSTTVQVQVQGGSGSILDPLLGARSSAALDRERRRAVFRLADGQNDLTPEELGAEDDDDEYDGEVGDRPARDLTLGSTPAVKRCAADPASLGRIGPWCSTRGVLNVGLRSTMVVPPAVFSVLRSSSERITSTMLFLGEVGGDRAASPSIDVSDDADA